MTEVKSTFNFVPAPLEENVYHPKWDHQVSHDIPFEDGESGELEIEITAETDIFIRNGHLKDQEELEFSHMKLANQEKKYFIPASSLKGMFRNVLEIMSFSRIKQIANNRYAHRSLTPGSLYMTNYDSNLVQCGWLYADEAGNWWIKDCGTPLHIPHQTVDQLLGTNFRRKFLNRNPEQKTAIYKYQLATSHQQSLQFQFKSEKLNPDNPVDPRQLAIPNRNGQEGTIVFTGQSGKRKEEEGEKPTGKLHEFVFLKPPENHPPLKILDKQQQDFRFIYLEHDSNNISPDWKHWKEKLAQGQKVPIFFTRAKPSSPEKDIQHFGLAFLYKLPYDKSVHEILPYRTYCQKREDLSELIFGHTNEKIGALKGRVMISNAFSYDAEPSTEVQKEILAGPKASYLPFYLNQDGQGNRSNKYKDYMNENSEIRGFKRYPVHGTTKKGIYSQKQLENLKVFSEFIPLQAGAKFHGKIRFHNLRKAEIGALISSITFHGNSDTYFHSIGGAKPFGYGKIKVIINKTRFLKEDLQSYLIKFEQLMQKASNSDWVDQPALQELIGMASASNQEDLLTYPKMDLNDLPQPSGSPKIPQRHANEFKNYEKEKLHLKKYSEYNGLPQLLNIQHKLKKSEDLISRITAFNRKTLKDLKAQIKALLKELQITLVPPSRHSDLIEAIKFIYANHKVSNRKLNKSFEWENTIPKWIGKEKAEQLCLELTGKTIDELKQNNNQ